MRSNLSELREECRQAYGEIISVRALPKSSDCCCGRIFCAWLEYRYRSNEDGRIYKFLLAFDKLSHKWECTMS